MYRQAGSDESLLCCRASFVQGESFAIEYITTTSDDNRRANPCPLIRKLAKDKKSVNSTPDDKAVLNRRQHYGLCDFQRFYNKDFRYSREERD